MNKPRLLLSIVSFVSVYPCSKLIMASLAVDTKVPAFDEKDAAKKNEEEIFAALTGEQLESISVLKSKMSHDKLKRWPVAGERMALYRFLKARDFDVDQAIDYAKRVNPNLEIILLSAKNGEGMDEIAKQMCLEKHTFQKFIIIKFWS